MQPKPAFWVHFSALCTKQGSGPERCAVQLGFSAGAVVRWKNGKQPSAASLQRIAAHFCVAPDVLLFGDRAPSVLRKAEAERLRRALIAGGYPLPSDCSPAQKDALCSAAVLLANAFPSDDVEK